MAMSYMIRHSRHEWDHPSYCEGNSRPREGKPGWQQEGLERGRRGGGGQILGQGQLWVGWGEKKLLARE